MRRVGAAFRRLDLDHLGAEPGQQQPGILGPLVGDLDDAQPGQHARPGIAHHLARSLFDRALIRHAPPPLSTLPFDWKRARRGCQRDRWHAGGPRLCCACAALAVWEERAVPYGGNDWLALTEEPTLEPEIPICDPHHHFWDLRTGRIPYQRYLLHELVADVSRGHNVRSTVFIEARAMYRADGPAEMRPVGEVEFVQGLAAASASGLYGPCRAAAAIVGHADLKLGDRVEPVLEALQAASPNRFRGIRHIVTWDADPRVESRETEGVLSTPEFRAGAKVLGRMGLSLDTICCFPQLPEMVALRPRRARGDDHHEPSRRAATAPARSPAATTR